MENINSPKIDLGLDKRKVILGVALSIEGLTSGYLAGLLEIKDIENSRTLSNKGSALSFNQKIDLLIDLGALDSDSRAKFMAFMEIRNQFMHNMEATTYEKCFSYLQGKDKYILKTYPQPNAESLEAALEAASLALASEVFKLTGQLFKVLDLKFQEKANNQVSKTSNDAFKRTIPQVQNILNEFVDQLGDETGKFKVESFKNIGTQVGKMIYQLWEKNYHLIVEEEKKEKDQSEVDTASPK